MPDSGCLSTAGIRHQVSGIARACRLVAFHAVAAAFLFASVAGCAPRRTGRRVRVVPKEKEPRDLVPREGAGLVWEWAETSDGRLSYRVLHPFIAGEIKPGKRVFVLRPLFSHEDEGPGSTRWTFRALWPLITIQRDDDAHRVRIWPVVWERKRSKLGDVKDKDFWILPFIWYGNDTEEGKYFAFWPFGGMIKGVFGKRYIRFVLWPLWVETKDKHYHSWNYPWPILGHWRGPDQRGWRFWPFYGVNQRDGKFKRVFFLWPLGHYWRTGLDTDAPGMVFAFLPFYAKMDNKNFRYVSVLWPFFARKHNKKARFVEWHAPWPLFSRTTGKGIRGIKFFPLYEHRFAPDISTRSVGWKVFHRKVEWKETRKTTKVSSCIVFQYIKDEWIEEVIGGKVVRRAPPRTDRMAYLKAEREGKPPRSAGRKVRPPEPGTLKSRTNTLLWPLFRYKRSERGEIFFTIFEPWFWRNREIWDRHYAPFFTLYRYERFSDGSVRERALFNLYEHYRSDIERRVRFSPFVDYWRRGVPAQYKRFRILGGLWAYERRGRKKRVRIFWIPIGRKPKGWDAEESRP
jgi:hypothetical protein